MSIGYMFFKLMRNMKVNKIIALVLSTALVFGFITAVNAESENNKNTEFNLYAGKFDFSDHSKNSNLFGIEHESQELFRNTFLGKISPITGGFITGAGAAYLYTGIQGQYELGPINFTPSFTPGYYSQGDGKDLGSLLQFKSEVQLSLDLFDNSSLGMSYNHISNAILGDVNPGANSYMFNFLQKF